MGACAGRPSRWRLRGAFFLPRQPLSRTSRYLTAIIISWRQPRAWAVTTEDGHSSVPRQKPVFYPSAIRKPNSRERRRLPSASGDASVQSGCSRRGSRCACTVIFCCDPSSVGCVMAREEAFFGLDRWRRDQSDSDQCFPFQHFERRRPMHFVTARRMTLCGVMASATIVAAGSSVPLMMGGCGANETILCPPDDEDAGADDGGQGGADTKSTSSSLCD